jgi:uncharacterized protein (DUF302 family)
MLAIVDEAGIRTFPCGQAVEQVFRRVVAEIDQRQLTIFAVIDHSGEAEEVGLTMPNTKLVIFGSPRRATPLKVAHPEIALDLPMKLLVWERDDGQVFVTFNAPEYLAARYRLSADETDALRAVEAIAAVAADSN